MNLSYRNYLIEIDIDSTYNLNSADNVNAYENKYFAGKEDILTKIGIRLYDNGAFITSVLVASEGWATYIHETSQSFKNDRIVICCGNTLFCLSIPDFGLVWKNSESTSSCIEVIGVNQGYLVHQENGDILRLDDSGKVQMKNYGPDVSIFKTSQ